MPEKRTKIRMRRSRVADGECLQRREVEFGFEFVFAVFEDEDEDLWGFGVKEEEGGMVKKKRRRTRWCMLRRDCKWELSFSTLGFGLALSTYLGSFDYIFFFFFTNLKYTLKLY